LKSKNFFYIILISILITSVLASYFLPVSELFRILAILPGIFSILGIIAKETIIQYFSYKQEYEIEKMKQNFSLSIDSHMSQTVFDRHVSFCEEYFALAYDLMQDLARNGPELDLTKAQSLTLFRVKNSLWLTEDIEKSLIPFENSLRVIAGLGIATKPLEPSETRTKLINKQFDTFISVTGLNVNPEELSTEDSINAVINHLRKILGIPELTKIRNRTLITYGK
jgi:hypothetical protein